MWTGKHHEKEISPSRRIERLEHLLLRRTYESHLQLVATVAVWTLIGAAIVAAVLLALWWKSRN
jgi:hypothetical protein